jgi:hypothetical protein
VAVAGRVAVTATRAATKIPTNRARYPFTDICTSSSGSHRFLPVLSGRGGAG